MSMINIAIFASGSGTNAENIIKYFNNSDKIRIGAVFCNSSTAGVIDRAERLGIECHIFDKEELNNPNGVSKKLKELCIEYIILAGFLLLIPEHLINEFKNRIINIHPALLPKFGGKGMYGMNVHKAVFESGEKVSGITIHTVDSHYDQGNTIFQAETPIDSTDSPETIAEKIHTLEYKHFPTVVEEYIITRCINRQ